MSPKYAKAAAERKKEAEEKKEAKEEKPIDTSSSKKTEQAIVDADLEDMLSMNGEDIDYEFYYQGQLVNTSSTLFEILKKTAGEDSSKLPTDSVTITFVIKERKEVDVKMRANSILELAKES